MTDTVIATRMCKSKPVDKNSTTEGALAEFTLFPKLPIELRLKIWKLAAAPRWVVVGERKVPGIFHACAESRKESKYDYRFLRPPPNPYPVEVGMGILANYERDILYIEYSNKMDYPFFILWLRWPRVLEPILRIAFSLLEVSMECNQEGQNSRRGWFWEVLEEFCPNLVELIVMVRSGPLGSDFDDLYEVDQVPAGVAAEKNLVLSTLRKEQAQGYWKDLKLTFMRNETWER